MIPFGPWKPDTPAFGSDGATVALNVVPLQNHYEMVRNPISFATALPATCLGMFVGRKRDSSPVVIAGTSTALYKLNPAAKTITGITKANPAVVTSALHGFFNGDIITISGVVGMTEVNGGTFVVAGKTDNTFQLYGVNSTGYTAYVSGGTIPQINWADITRETTGTKVPYSVPAGELWQFHQFGDWILAVNNYDAWQKYDTEGSSSPNICVNLSSGTPAQDPPVCRFVTSARNFVFAGDTYDTTDGYRHQRVRWSRFCIDFDDCDEWQVSAVNQSDYNELFGDGGNIMRILGGEYLVVFLENEIHRAEYVGSPVVWQFAKVESGRGTPAPHSVIEVSSAGEGRLIFYLGQDGWYTFNGNASAPIGAGSVDRWFYDDADPFYINLVQGCADPARRIVYWAYASKNAQSGVKDSILVYNWETGRWSLIRMDTEFVFAYATQGYNLDQLDPFGTLETLPYSLDSRVWAGGQKSLAIVDTSHSLAGLSGEPMNAVIETGEAQLIQNRRSVLLKVRPMVDIAGNNLWNGELGRIGVSIGYRSQARNEYTWTSRALVDDLGCASVRVNARYHRMRLTLPAEAALTGQRAVPEANGPFEWERAMGVDIYYAPAGDR